MVEKIYMIYTDIPVMKKKGRRDCTFKFAHDHVIEKDAFIREKKNCKRYVNIRAKHLDNYKVVQGNIKRALS